MTDDLKCQSQSVVELDHRYVLAATWAEFKDFSPQDVNMNTAFCSFHFYSRGETQKKAFILL